PHSSPRQQLDQVAVSPSLQQTGQTDRRPDDVTAGWLVDPYAPDQCAKSLRVFVHELGIDGDRAPTVCTPSSMTAWNSRSSHALRVITSAGAEINIGISSSSVRWTAPPRAPDEVSISARAGHSRSISETQPSAATTRSDLATKLIS